MQSRPGHPQNFKLISKSSYMRPVFPDYLSVSYDYEITFWCKHEFSWYVIRLVQQWKIMSIILDKDFQKSGLLFKLTKTYSQITKEPHGFKMQIFKVLYSEVREPTDKLLCLYDLTWETTL